MNTTTTEGRPVEAADIEEKRKEHAGKMSRLIGKAWNDEEFKKRLLSDPKGVMSEYGINPPKGREVKVVENTDHVIHFVLPMRPALSVEELDKVAGGQILFDPRYYPAPEMPSDSLNSDGTICYAGDWCY